MDNVFTPAIEYDKFRSTEGMSNAALAYVTTYLPHMFFAMTKVERMSNAQPGSTEKAATRSAAMMFVDRGELGILSLWRNSRSERNAAKIDTEP